MKKINAVILSHSDPDYQCKWTKACHEKKDVFNCNEINITKNNWLENINKLNKNKIDVFLLQPPGISSLLKQMYDERIYILNKILKFFVYPTFDEILLYENKRYLSYWLKANGIPHPNTNVFYFYDDAIDFLKKNKFPVVAKTNIGASGSGVVILKNFDEGKIYITNAFKNKGVYRRWGPNLKKGHILSRGLHYVYKPKDLITKIEIYKKNKTEVQKGFVIFQEYIKHDFEWRIVVIGNSFFAHKKLKIDNKASGTTLKDYTNPPFYIFDFAKNIMDRFGFLSQALDVFETENGNLLINEMQCFFGQSDPYQMLVDNQPGRYRKNKDTWVFEKGYFNKNECYNLRLEHIINLLHDNFIRK